MCFALFRFRHFFSCASGRELFREQSLKMLQTGVEEFKIFLWKISHPNIKFYFGFIPQQKYEKKVNTPTTKKNV